jgi:hypothetical protein
MRTLLCLALASCNAAHATPSTPTASGEIRGVAAFHGLSVTTVIDVTVTIGAVERVELRGPKDWVGKLETKVDNDILTIAMPGNPKNIPKLEAVITVPELSSIAISGVAGVHAGKLAAKTLDVTISGVGSIDLAGTADTLHVTVSGSGELMAKDLTTSTTTLAVSGSGDATVRATKQVDADVSGVGNIKILGNPGTIHKRISGVAEID